MLGIKLFGKRRQDVYFTAPEEVAVLAADTLHVRPDPVPVSEHDHMGWLEQITVIMDPDNDRAVVRFFTRDGFFDVTVQRMRDDLPATWCQVCHRDIQPLYAGATAYTHVAKVGSATEHAPVPATFLDRIIVRVPRPAGIPRLNAAALSGTVVQAARFTALDEGVLMIGGPA